MIYLIAFLLGTSQATPPETPANWSLLKQFAIRYEIAGPHEQWYSWSSELEYVRRHYRELRDAPPLADCRQLPSQEFVDRIREHLRGREAFMRNYLAGCSPREAEAAAWRLEDIRYLSDLYHEVDHAKNNLSWAAKRAGLKRLRDVMGEEAYYFGLWPVP